MNYRTACGAQPRFNVAVTVKHNGKTSELKLHTGDHVEDAMLKQIRELDSSLKDLSVTTLAAHVEEGEFDPTEKLLQRDCTKLVFNLDADAKPGDN